VLNLFKPIPGLGVNSEASCGGRKILG
jgi:hypothetical protein